MKRFAILLSALGLMGQAFASSPGFMSTTTASGRRVVVKAIDGNIFRVSNLGPGQDEMVTQAASLEAQPFEGSVSRSGASIIMTLPSGVTATLDRTTGAVTFADGSATLLTDNGLRPEGSIALTPHGGAEAFYGAGERGHSFKLNGDTLVMYNRQNYGYTDSDPRISQMNITMPYFVSNEGYGVLFDDHAPATMVMADPIVYTSEVNAPVSYYFIYGGGNLAGVTSEFTRLTGRQALPPFWALGYITSKYGYRTEAETRGVIDTLRREGYPVDGVVLDLYWYGEETDMGRFAWAPSQWPDHRGMLADLDSLGVNTVIISQPYVNKKGAIDNYRELAAGNMLTRDSAGRVNDVTTWVGEAGMLDVANPDTRRWLRDRYRKLTDEGVAGWWGDLGEPEVHPETIVHANGMTAREFHNVYGNVWSSIIYDLYNDEYPDTRLMTLMRGGTAGLQRYSVFPWSTDVSRSWGGLKPQVKIMLNSGLSGLGYMSHDVGGFAIDEERPVDPELYVRWLQLGTFSPILRTHAQKVAEPYLYPEQKDIILPLVKMRYTWLPYNYTLAWENATKGYPLVRPLNFLATSPSPLDTITDEYLWGNDLLVAPVMEQGATGRRILLPPGTWVNYNHPDKSYTGPDIITIPAPLSELPMLVRAGAFIPQADYEMANTRDYDPSRYTVLYYPRDNGTSSYTLFEDNRLSTKSLARGEYALIHFEGDARKNDNTITVTLEGDYPGMARTKEITLMLPGLMPKMALVDGQRAHIKFSDDDVPGITFTLTPDAPVNIAIR